MKAIPWLAAALVTAVGSRWAMGTAAEARPGAAPATLTAVTSAPSEPGPAFNPKALWDGRRSVEFHACDNPRMVPAAKADFLIDDEYVLGLAQNGESRAYPTRFVSWHHIVNDRIGKPELGGRVGVAITYCIVCNSGIRFDTGPAAASFDFYGLYNGVMTMYDRESKSVWLQVSGRAVKGPKQGQTLNRGPLLDTTWSEWKRLHPDTLVMAPDPRFADCYEPRGSVMLRGYEKFPEPYFGRTVTHRDTRLPMFEPVLAVSVPVTDDPGAMCSAGPRLHHAYRAYPLRAFRGLSTVVNERIDGTPVAVLFMGPSETASAVSPIVNGRVLTLEAQGRAFFDLETGSHWTVEGKAVAGPLKGTQLVRVDSHMSQWYGWVSYFPQTTIYERVNTARSSHDILTADSRRPSR